MNHIPTIEDPTAHYFREAILENLSLAETIKNITGPNHAQRHLNKLKELILELYRQQISLRIELESLYFDEDEDYDFRESRTRHFEKTTTDLHSTVEKLSRLLWLIESSSEKQIRYATFIKHKLIKPTETKLDPDNT